jgi:hypothetical protein
MLPIKHLSSNSILFEALNKIYTLKAPITFSYLLQKKAMVVIIEISHAFFPKIYPLVGLSLPNNI